MPFNSPTSSRDLRYTAPPPPPLTHKHAHSIPSRRHVHTYNETLRASIRKLQVFLGIWSSQQAPSVLDASMRLGLILSSSVHKLFLPIRSPFYASVKYSCNPRCGHLSSVREAVYVAASAPASVSASASLSASTSVYLRLALTMYLPLSLPLPTPPSPEGPDQTDST